MSRNQAVPESQLLNYLFVKTILIVNHEAMNLLPLTVSLDCSPDYFNEQLTSLETEAREALTELRDMYMNALTTDRDRANKIKRIIDYFVLLHRDANAQIDFTRMTAVELQRVFNIQFF
ncbi:hypothetical protein Lbir_1689 [Legionella birminghamensis]|uniref:Uncharacterized protein n=1 Tax=Legionella birminghamensis TaxID=28083 RepID=A0A378I7W6_9GAMM|nr:hypothetical protein [Legionella birminghamensis]KTC71537.1 hypothetical protein Lbir_1689 [Legionella birminghamensis]STX30855.1 Uncharacterised protein [Legionella birminghamensis]